MMTSTDAGKLSADCILWRDHLRSFRETLLKNQLILRNSASHQSSREDLLQVEHLHNQLHIQLINIHDLKHAVKQLLQKIAYESDIRGKLTDSTLAKHETLQDEFRMLENTLRNVREEFEAFISYAVA